MFPLTICTQTHIDIRITFSFYPEPVSKLFDGNSNLNFWMLTFKVWQMWSVRFL